MPRGYGYPRRTAVWIPVQGFLKTSNKDWIKLRGSRMYPAIGRLRPGVSLAQAQADLDAISARLARDYPITNRDFRLGIQSLRDAEAGTIRPYLWLLFAATMLVLIVCAANLANLSLAVAADRARESAVRLALGASRMRVAALFLTQSVIVSVAGGACGLVLAQLGVSAIPLVAFAALALLLSAVGLYGVIGYLVKQRQFEFGIRLALGASRGNILGNVTFEGLRLVFVGLVAGTALSAVLARSISSLLAAVTAYDPIVFAVVLSLVSLVGLVAVLLPAYRAMSVEPSNALRAQ